MLSNRSPGGSAPAALDRSHMGVVSPLHLGWRRAAVLGADESPHWQSPNIVPAKSSSVPSMASNDLRRNCRKSGADA